MLFQDTSILRKEAMSLFQKTPDSIQQDIEIIKKWLKTQIHLPELIEDVKIGNFLLVNKYSIEKTKQKIDLYYSIRSLLPDIFENSNPRSPNLQKFMDVTYVCYHTKAIDDLYRICFTKFKHVNALMPIEYAQYFFNLSEIRLYEDCVAGDVAIFDMSNFTLNDLKKVNPVLLSKFVKMTQVFSTPIKRVYLINSPYYVDKLLHILKMVLKPKLLSRIHVCSDDSVLKDILKHEDLPKEYGGDGPSLEELNEQIKKKFKEYQKRFDALDTLRVDDSKRPQKLSNDEVLGFYGSFKRLSVD